jgi:nucleoside-diphosphate-sugar epimerase
MTAARLYLVTGAAGFIGSHLVERLLSDGHRVRAVDRFSPYYDRSIKESNLTACRKCDRFELVETDLAEADLEVLLSDVDGVFHLAAQPGVRASWGEGFGDYVRDNVVATQRLFEALRHRPAPTVYASSSSVYGNARSLPVTEDRTDLQPISPYGLTKLNSEHLARIYVSQHGIHVVGLRYFTVYGPRQRPDMAFTRFSIAALKGQPLHLYGDGRQSRDFTFVADAVEATVRALRMPAGQIYNIGGGEPATLGAVFDILSELVGRPVKIDRDRMAVGDVGHTWADTRKARNEMGWAPRTTLRAGLAAQVEWVRECRSAVGAVPGLASVGSPGR